MSRAEEGSILLTGAKAGDPVEGMTEKNRGLVLRLRQDQAKGENGWLKGRFDVLEAGTGPYSSYIQEFVGQTTTVSEMQGLLLESINATQAKSLSRLTVFDRNSIGLRVAKE